MAKITLNVEDDYIEAFLNELDKFCKENNISEKDLTIFGLSIEDFRKTLDSNPS